MGGDNPRLFLWIEIYKLSVQDFATWRIILTPQFDRAFNAFLRQLLGGWLWIVSIAELSSTFVYPPLGILYVLGPGFLFITTRINGSCLRLVR